MTAPEVLVLDTRDATSKAQFLSTCARDLRFPDYFGANWDAFEECLRDFVMDRPPTLVIWTGAGGLPDDVRQTALQIFGDTLVDGVDLVVVDADPQADERPDFVALAERVAVPRDGTAAAAAFWGMLGLPMADGVHDGPGLTLQLVEVDDHHPGIGPVLGVADLDTLRRRVAAADLPHDDDGRTVTLADPFGTLISFTPY